MLNGDWLDRVLAKIDVQEEVGKITKRRQQVENQLKRLGRAYVDGLYSDSDYNFQKQSLQSELDSLVISEADAATEAGRLVENLPELWAEADLEQGRKLVITMLDAVYVDMKVSRSIVAIKPKAPFMPIFDVATTREGSGIRLVKETRYESELPVIPVITGLEDHAGRDITDDWMLYWPQGQHDQEANRCFWWRRGGVEPPVQKSLPRISYRLSRLFNPCSQGLNRRSPQEPAGVILDQPPPASG